MITPKMREGMRRLTGVGKITHTDKDYITALTDLHEKRPSSGRGAVEMRAKIDAYLDEKLAGDEKAELSPGAFKTKFKHVIRVDTNEPLAAGDATYQTDSAVRHALISHALGHATDGNKAIVCNVFTMNDVLTGHDPSIGSTLEQLQVPFVGIDGHGNPAFLLHHQHSGNKDLMDRLGQSHSDSVTPALQNKNAWNCAAWLSAFLQFKSGDLARSLSPPDDFDPALRERLIKVAELARTAEGLNAITGQDPAADNSAQPAEFKLQYPANFDDDTFKGNILEKDLMDATAILLKGRKDIFGVELLFPKNKKFNSSHVFSVMNALGVKAVIHGDGTGVEGALVDTISCSHPSVMAHLDAMKWEDKQSHVVEMAELCKEVPILVRLGERGYALRMPKATPGAAGANASGSRLC